MNNLQKFLALVDPTPSTTVFKLEKELDERYWKRLSQIVALVVMDRAEYTDVYEVEPVEVMKIEWKEKD